MVLNCLNISAIKEMLANSYIGPRNNNDVIPCLLQQKRIGILAER